MRSALLVALLAPAFAQASEGDLTIGLAAGAVFTDQLEPFGHGMVVLPRVGYSPADGIDFELDLPVAKGKTRYQQHAYTMLMPRVQFRGMFIPDTRLQPFGTVGTGVFVKSASAPETQPKGFVQGDVDWLLNLGPGVQFALTDALVVRTDYRIVANFGTERFDNYGDTFLNWEWTAGIGWIVGRKDADKDGVSDSKDACPNEPEDVDGFDDTDGCPDPDNDGDGILDTADTCPVEPEDVDGFQDDDGCPDPDNDDDGILDADDACPIDAGVESAAGCPDADGDGVTDAADACPDVAGTDEHDGCADTDGDGFADPDDECVDTPGEAFGCADADADGVPDPRDACPDVPADDRIDPERSDGCVSRVFLGADKVYVTEPIAFPAGKATLAGESTAVLDEVAALLEANDDLRVEIGVHSDSADDADLTAERAQAIAEHLIGAGIAGDRLEAKGYGASRPIEGAESSERIDFVLVREVPTEEVEDAAPNGEVPTEEVEDAAPNGEVAPADDAPEAPAE